MADDFAPVYQQTQEKVEGAAWRAAAETAARPRILATPQDMVRLVQDIAPRYGVDPLVPLAIMSIESGGNPNVGPSRKGAEGLMQLMPGTQKRFGVSDPSDPVQNITGGVRYLAFLKNQFPGRLDLQFAGYHAGENAVRKAGNAIPDAWDGNMTTAEYVATRLAFYNRGRNAGSTPSSVSAPAPAQMAKATAAAPEAPPTTPLASPVLPYYSSAQPLPEPAAQMAGNLLDDRSTGQAPSAIQATPGQPVVAASPPSEERPTPLAAFQTWWQTTYPSLPPAAEVPNATGGLSPSPLEAFQAWWRQTYPALPVASEIPSAVSPQTPGPLAALRDWWTAKKPTVVSALTPQMPGVPSSSPEAPVSTTAIGPETPTPFAAFRDWWQRTYPGLPPAAEVPSAIAPETPSPVAAATQALAPTPPPVAPGEPGLVEPLLQRLAPHFTAGVIEGVGSLVNLFPNLSRSPLDPNLTDVALTSMATAVRPGTPATLMDRIADGLGQGAAFFLPGMGIEAAAAKIAAIAPRLAATFGAATSAVLQGATVAQQLQEQLTPLVGDEEAARRANKLFWWNTLLAGIGGKLGIFATGLPSALTKVLAGATAQGVQGALQYDLNRRAFWVPADHPAAQSLLALGWEQHEDRIEQPYVPGDQMEAGLIQAVVGATFAGLEARAHPEAFPATLEAVRQDPGFSIDRALLAAFDPAHPPADVPLALWQRWGEAVLRAPIGTAIAGPEVPPEPAPATRESPEAAVPSPAPTSSPEPATRAPVPAPIAPPVASALPMEAPGPTLAGGAEGISRENYRTPGGDWRMPLGEIPSHELELQDFVRQQGGIKLASETDVPGELRAVISRAETGTTGLQNNTGGLSLQEMAERAQQHDFLPTADKAGLLEALDRSVTQGKPVYSTSGTGSIAALDNPYVRTAYQTTLDALRAMAPRTQEQVGGVRHREVVGEEATQMREAGFFGVEDIREIAPNTALNDTAAAALTQAMDEVGLQMAHAARAYMESGGQVGSPEEAAFLQTMGLFAELDPYRRGVSAAQARGLGILNDPLSTYNRFLDGLHKTMQAAPEWTVRRIAEKVLGVEQSRTRALEDAALLPTPEALAGNPELRAQYEAVQERLQTAIDRMNAATPHPSATQQELMFPQHWMDDADWTRLQQSYADLATLEATAKPSTRQWMDDAGWREMRAAYAAMQQEVQSSEQLQGQPFYPGAGPWRTVAEWQTHLDAFRQRVDPRTQDTLNGVLRPWESQPTQLALLGAMETAKKPGFSEYFLEAYYNAIFSNPATHLANFLGNLSTMAYSIPERWMGEQYGKGHPEQGVAVGEATALTYGYIHAIQDAWAVAARSARTGEPVFGATMKEGVDTRSPVWTAHNLGVDPASPMGKLLDFWANYIGFANFGRLPSKLLMAGDEFFKVFLYRGELNALAYREATRNGYEGPAWGEHVAGVLEQPSLPQMQEAAKNFSVYHTFQDTLPDGGLGQKIQGIADWRVLIPGTGVEVPLGRVIIPIIQTPMNMARFATERTPLGLAMASTMADIKAGGARADMAQAKVALGTLMMTAIAGYALTGRLTGRGPEDPDLRQLWLERHPEYSAQLPDGTWIALDRILGPFSMHAGWVGDFVQLMGETQIPEAERAAVGILYGYMRNLTNKTWFQGASDFFDAMSPRPYVRGEQFLGSVGRYAIKQSVRMLQPSSFLAATARAGYFNDPAQRDTHEFLDALAARVPGWGGPARRSLGGDKMLLGYGFADGMIANTLRAYTPLLLDREHIGPGDNEILDNKMTLSKPPRTWAHGTLPEGSGLGDTPVDMSSLRPMTLSDKDYERFSVLAGGNQGEAAKLGLRLPNQALENVTDAVRAMFDDAPTPKKHMGLEEMVDWVVAQSKYRNPEETSAGKDGGRNHYVAATVQLYRNMGRNLLLLQDPKLQMEYEGARSLHALNRIPESQRPAAAATLQEAYAQQHETFRDFFGMQETPPARSAPRGPAPPGALLPTPAASTPARGNDLWRQLGVR